MENEWNSNSLLHDNNSNLKWNEGEEGQPICASYITAERKEIWHTNMVIS